MKETTKTLNYYPWLKDLLVGKIIDIGSGNDPVTEDCYRFDKKQGDASHILDFVKDTYDVVYSSHFLETMENPVAALSGWFELVKPGGRMILIVSDEDLYEQGIFPSTFNAAHLWTFTIGKSSSWSSNSLNIIDLIGTLKNYDIERIQKQSDGYDFTATRKDQTRGKALAQIMTIIRKPA